MNCAKLIIDEIVYLGSVLNYTYISYLNRSPQLAFTMSDVNFPDNLIGKECRFEAKGRGFEVCHNAKIFNKNTVMILT